jgi:hypothetical protein
MVTVGESTTAWTRRVDSRRFSVGPVDSLVESRSCSARLINGCFYRFLAFSEQLVRESSPVSAFCLVVVWISYFVGVFGREALLISNGALIALLIISAFLKRKHMKESLRQRRHIRRAFPRGAILRPESHPDLSSEDLEVTQKIRTLYVDYVINLCTTRKLVDVASESSPCLICLLDIGREDCIQQLPCEHIFHKTCLCEVCSILINPNVSCSGSTRSYYRQLRSRTVPLAEKKSMYKKMCCNNL